MKKLNKNEILKQQNLERKLSILKALNPKFSKDGNQWCYLYGELPNDCIVGFGDTPYDAMNDFVKNFYSQKAVMVSNKTDGICDNCRHNNLPSCLQRHSNCFDPKINS